LGPAAMMTGHAKGICAQPHGRGVRCVFTVDLHVSSFLPLRPAHLWSIDPRGDRRQPEDSRRASPWLARRRGTSGTRPPRPGSPRSTEELADCAQAPTPIPPRDASIDQARLPTPSYGQPWWCASPTQSRSRRAPDAVQSGTARACRMCTAPFTAVR
jgi:hypothetical protein